MKEITKEEKAARYDLLVRGIRNRVDDTLEDLAYDNYCDVEDLPDRLVCEALEDKITCFFEELFYDQKNKDVYELCAELVAEQAGLG